VLTVDPVARLEVGHGRLGGAPRAEGGERQLEVRGQPEQGHSVHKYFCTGAA
jgi:hypothetical protein